MMILGPKFYRLPGFFLMALFFCCTVNAHVFVADTVQRGSDPTKRYDSFYDSLKTKAQQRKFTRFLHKTLISNPKPAGTKGDTLAPHAPYQGKTIGTLKIIRLDVFGPSLRDTSRKATLWYEKAGNFIHTRSDLHNIRKNLLFRKGEMLQADELYENERLLRALPYIRDARFYVEPDTLNPGQVMVTLFIQDRFSIGMTGDVNGTKSAALEIYNHNIFGVGHQLSFRMVGHLTREPFMGVETFYKVSNISGRFISFTAGYMNTYLNEGAMVVLNKDFLRVSDPWGYGAAGHLFKRTPHLPGELQNLDSVSIGYDQFSGWAGRNFQLGHGSPNSQLTVSGQFISRYFSNRPAPLPDGQQYYYHTRMYLASLTWSRRTFQTDELIYGYGITEDIPRGFKHELVVGYDNNEFDNRLYSHLQLSNGNLLGKKPGFLYGSAAIGGYFHSGKVTQGLVELSGKYISKLFTAGNARFRQFVNIDFKQGINRYDKEKLHFDKNNLIRGFESREVSGKQRLSLNMETVYFQKRDFYRFNMAFFAFGDLGIISAANQSVFRGHYYSGIGIGLRVHNESLVFKTLQVRLSLYPAHPADVGPVGFLLNEQSRQTFYTFQPGPPAPRRFE